MPRRPLVSALAALVVVVVAGVVGGAIGVAVRAVGTADDLRHAQVATQVRFDKITRDDQATFTRIVEVVGSQNNVAADVVLGRSLRSIDHLPGTRAHVDPGQRQALVAATVKLGKRARGETTWEPWCTGTAVTSGGRTYVMTAAHCFLVDLNVPDATFVEGQHDLREVTHLLAEQWTVLDLSSLSGDPRPLGRVAKAVAPVDYSSDWAFLRVDGPGGLGGAVPIDLGQVAATDRQPVPGEPVALHSYPGAAMGSPVDEIGTYVGRTNGVSMSGYTQSVDLVAIDPSSSAADACFYGASGSSARFANGTISGPLSSRNTIGYGTAHTLDDPDASGAFARLDLEAQTKVDLTKPVVLCAYSASTDTVVPDMLALLDRA